MQGVEVWNQWREENFGVFLNLGSTDFRKADLRKINLRGVYLSQADFTEANFCGASFRSADLYKSNFCKANLRGVVMGLADLSDANLTEADLHDADLSFANLSEANLENTRCWGTLFTDVDLSEVKGLGNVRHDGPSSIGIDTLYKSKGNIPEVFLRGCGVPDQMIEYAKSLTGSPIEYYSCFISYSHKDEEFAKRIHNDLQAAGVRCWFAPHDIQAGKKIHHQIDEAIRFYDKLLLILSPDSMNSNWVGNEIIRAKKKEDRQGSQMLFPVGIVPYQKIQDWEFFDSDSGRDLAREIREYFITDFSLWKSDHDAYKNAFDSLLRDLKAG